MGKCINILFLGGAKRVTMARMFKRAASSRGLQCKIIGYEMNINSALACEGTIIKGLKWNDPNIYSDLERVCNTYNIDIIIPFVDGAVRIAADFVYKYKKTKIFTPVGNTNIAESMFDKIKAARIFEEKALPIPQTYKIGMACDKLIAKPQFGSASKGIMKIDNLYELEHIDNTKYLIQHRIDNREEITVDCYVSTKNREILAISPRIRTEVNGGEVVRTITIDDTEAAMITKDALTRIDLRGAVTVQLIRDLESNKLMIMEINPRLGGGAVASVNAGVDLPGLIIDDCQGNKLTKQSPAFGVETVRYLADVVFYPEKI